jgi:ATP synthase protein I
MSNTEPGDDKGRFETAVKSQTRRRFRAAQGEGRGVLYWVGMFGLIGWSVALPTVLGIALGLYIDGRWESRFSWTLMLLFAGLVVGCLTAWRWMHSESPTESTKERNEP